MKNNLNITQLTEKYQSSKELGKEYHMGPSLIHQSRTIEIQNLTVFFDEKNLGNSSNSLMTTLSDSTPKQRISKSKGKKVRF